MFSFQHIHRCLYMFYTTNTLQFETTLIHWELVFANILHYYVVCAITTSLTIKHVKTNDGICSKIYFLDISTFKLSCTFHDFTTYKWLLNQPILKLQKRRKKPNSPTSMMHELNVKVNNDDETDVGHDFYLGTPIPSPDSSSSSLKKCL